MMTAKDEVTHNEDTHNAPPRKSLTEAHIDIVPIDQEATEDVRHINLGWRSWVVVFVCCFAYDTLSRAKPQFS